MSVWPRSSLMWMGIGVRRALVLARRAKERFHDRSAGGLGID